MRPPLRERIRAALCRVLGHRETCDGYVITCHRCRLLLHRRRVRP